MPQPQLKKVLRAGRRAPRSVKPEPGVEEKSSKDPKSRPGEVEEDRDAKPLGIPQEGVAVGRRGSQRKPRGGVGVAAVKFQAVVKEPQDFAELMTMEATVLPLVRNSRKR